MRKHPKDFTNPNCLPEFYELHEDLSLGLNIGEQNSGILKVISNMKFINNFSKMRLFVCPFNEKPQYSIGNWENTSPGKISKSQPQKSWNIAVNVFQVINWFSL